MTEWAKLCGEGVQSFNRLTENTSSISQLNNQTIKKLITDNKYHEPFFLRHNSKRTLFFRQKGGVEKDSGGIKWWQ